MKLLRFIVFVTCLPILGCVNTEGTIDLKGKVIDEKTKVLIPRRTIIVQALVGGYTISKTVDTGQFITDSSGYFSYTLRKVKDAYFYNFCLVGDSLYDSSITKLGLYDFNTAAGFVTLSLSKLADFTIAIERKSKTPALDTLYVSWESDRIDSEVLYPDKIENFGVPPDIRHRWIGGNVKSLIRTKAYADKQTIIYFELRRNGKRKEFKDTIFCIRDINNYFNFKY